MRLFKDKPGGLVVDYTGIVDELKAALKRYTTSKGKGRPTIDTPEALSIFIDGMRILWDLLHGCDYSEFVFKALSTLSKAVNVAFAGPLACADGGAGVFFLELLFN